MKLRRKMRKERSLQRWLLVRPGRHWTPEELQVVRREIRYTMKPAPIQMPSRSFNLIRFDKLDRLAVAVLRYR